MAASKLSGNLLGVEIDGKFVACETSCEFNFEADMIDASALDIGRWKGVIPGLRSWSVSVNAAMLIQSSPTDFTTIINAFISGAKMRVRIRTKVAMIGTIMITGYVVVQSGGLSAAVNSTTGWNTTLQGDGAFELGSGGNQYQALYGYRLQDPFGDELNLQPQFSKFINSGDNTLALDFTVQSQANYLFAIIPHGQPIFNSWKNNPFNFGPIPDYLWRDVVTIGSYDYYMTRAIQYITSAVPVIVFSYDTSAPNPFNFIGVNNVEPGSVQISNTVTMAGIGGSPLNYSVTNGDVSKNGGAFSSSGGTVVNGDTLTLRQTATSSYSSIGITSLTVGSFTTGYSVGTRAANFVTVNYSIDFSRNPFVWMGYIPMIDRLDGNGFVEISRILSESTGSITNEYKEGYGIGFRQVTFPTSFPWVNGSGAYLQVDKDSSLFYQNTVSTQNTELQNPTYTIPAGSTNYDVSMLGINNGISGWLTHTLTTNGIGYNVNVSDSISLDFYLNVTPASNVSAFNINQRDNSDLNTVTITNNDPTGNSYRIQGVSGYDETIAIGVGLQGTKTDVPKGSITITKL